MLLTGLQQYLLTQTAITSLIAQGNAIQPIPAPAQDEDSSGNPLFPCITYQRVSDTTEYTLTGSAGLSTARVVFDCLALANSGGYDAAQAIAIAVKEALSGYQGTLSDGTRVFMAEVVNVVDLFSLDSMMNHSAVHVLVTYQD